MVEDVVPKLESSNSCCKAVRLAFFLLFSSFFGALLSAFLILLWLLWVQWKNEYIKLDEKRNALRQAIKFLEQQITKIQAEKLNLQKGRISIVMIFLCLFLCAVRTKLL